jgi:DNA-directed RNA polymerase specialized sigma24 family protein
MKTPINSAFNVWKLSPSKENMETLIHLIRSKVEFRFRNVKGVEEEDVAQETCLNVWKSICSGTYKDDGKLSAFVSTVAKNTALDFLKKMHPVNVTDDYLNAISDDGDTFESRFEDILEDLEDFL